MAAYVIYTQLEVTDQEALDEYRATVMPVMEKYGARVLAGGKDAKVFEGEWSGIGTFIIEFPDMDSIERWHTADDYKPLLEMRLGATRGNLIAVPGL